MKSSVIFRVLNMAGERINSGLQLCVDANNDVGDPSTVTRLILLADDLHARREMLVTEAREADVSCTECRDFFAEVQEFHADAAEYSALCAEMVHFDKLGFTTCGGRIVPLAGSCH